jgi:hydroxymethylpyrimidine/phosphomethylpyrimidine kinase
VKVPRVLIIAGSDSGGGAGIQADIKTVTMLGGHAMTAITAITAQNTLGVQSVFPLPTDWVEAQFSSVSGDLRIDAVKIGMLADPALVLTVRDLLYGIAPGTPIVLDPVMVATSGDALNSRGTADALSDLFEFATLLTPNLSELAILSRMEVRDEASMRAAALSLASQAACPVLAKGGHLLGTEVIDLLVSAGGQVERWTSAKIDTLHTHGTGCTLASGIATELGRGTPLATAVEIGRDYVQAAMLAAPGFGQGHGPMGHWLGVNPFEVIQGSPSSPRT